MKIGSVSIGKKTKQPKTLDRLSADYRKEVDQAIQKRRDAEKDVDDLLDSGFYFSVVFRTRKERDAWLAQRGIGLRDDDHILPSDLKM